MNAARCIRATHRRPRANCWWCTDPDCSIPYSFSSVGQVLFIRTHFANAIPHTIETVPLHVPVISSAIPILHFGCWPFNENARFSSFPRLIILNFGKCYIALFVFVAMISATELFRKRVRPDVKTGKEISGWAVFFSFKGIWCRKRRLARH